MTSNTSGFTPSRRTLVKGAAWSVPVVAIAAPAHAVGCSVDPRPCLEECLNFDVTADSCRRSNINAYHLGFVITNTCDDGTIPPLGDVTLTLRNHSGATLYDWYNPTVPGSITFTMPAPGESVTIPAAWYTASSQSLRIQFLYQGQLVGEVDASQKVGNCTQDPPGSNAATDALTSEDAETLSNDVEEPVVETESAPAETEAPAAEPAGAVDATPPATDGTVDGENG